MQVTDVDIAFVKPRDGLIAVASVCRANSFAYPDWAVFAPRSPNGRNFDVTPGGA